MHKTRRKTTNCTSPLLRREPPVVGFAASLVETREPRQNPDSASFTPSEWHPTASPERAPSRTDCAISSSATRSSLRTATISHRLPRIPGRITSKLTRRARLPQAIQARQAAQAIKRPRASPRLLGSGQTKPNVARCRLSSPFRSTRGPSSSTPRGHLRVRRATTRINTNTNTNTTAAGAVAATTGSRSHARPPFSHPTVGTRYRMPL